MTKKLIALVLTLILALSIGVIAYGNEGEDPIGYRLPITLPTCINCQCDDDSQCDDNEQ